MVKLLTYLTGSRTWIQPFSIIPELASNAEDATYLREVLGTGTLQNCLSLVRICRSLPDIAPLLPREDVDLDFAAILQSTADTEAKLITSGKYIGTSLPAPQLSVGEPTVTLRYYTDKLAYIVSGNKTLTATAYSPEENILVVHWPKELGLRGNLKLPSTVIWQEGASIVLPTRSSYPVAKVDRTLRNSDRVYDILWRQDLVSTFYSAATAEERIGICVLALINLSKV